MREENPIVYVVDDDPSVRMALERLLRSGGYETKTFASALEFLNDGPSHVPACLVLDIKMPKLNGLELQGRLSEKEISIPIVFITAYGTVPDSVKAFKAGATDFLEKPFKDYELLDAVSRGIRKHLILTKKKRRTETLTARLHTLTPREREVFKFVVSGMLNKQVAYNLGITEKTVKVHRAQVMQKMKAESFADLVRFAETLSIRSLET
jgi:FixJ family two-component response regulator